MVLAADTMKHGKNNKTKQGQKKKHQYLTRIFQQAYCNISSYI